MTDEILRMSKNIDQITAYIMDLKEENSNLKDENERLKEEIQMLLNELNR